MKKVMIKISLCMIITLCGCSKSIYDEFAISRFIETTSVRWGMQKEEAINTLKKEFPDYSIVVEDDKYTNNVTMMGSVETKIGNTEKITFQFSKPSYADNFKEPLIEEMYKERLGYVELYITGSTPKEIHDSLNKMFGDMEVKKRMLLTDDGIVLSKFTGEYVYNSSFTLYPETSLLRNTSMETQNKYRQLLSFAIDQDGQSMEKNFDMKLASNDSYFFFITVTAYESDSPIAVLLCAGPLGLMENIENSEYSFGID